MKFADLGLGPHTLKAIQSLGFETPTPIQAKAIPILLKGERDFIGLASTGTGKTAAFGLPLLEHIDCGMNCPQSVILCPTRELCLQIAGDLRDFCRYRPGFGIAAVYGGSNIMTQIGELRLLLPPRAACSI